MCAAATPHDTILRYRRRRPETKGSLCSQESISGVRPCCSSSTQFTGNSLRPRFQAWQVRGDRDDRDSCSTIRLSQRQRFPSSRVRRISHALKVASPTRFQLRDGGCRLSRQFPAVPAFGAKARFCCGCGSLRFQTPTVGRFAQRRGPLQRSGVPAHDPDSVVRWQPQTTSQYLSPRFALL